MSEKIIRQTEIKYLNKKIGVQLVKVGKKE